MSETGEHDQSEDPLPSSVRRVVSAKNQIQLPAAIATEVGFESGEFDVAQGAKVAWYYHAGDDKAVLGSDALNRPSLELVGTCRLSGISNDELATGAVDGATVTIISAFPDSLYERLTQGTVVLKPIYEGRHPELDSTAVSVYPAREYDNGTLPNVDRHLQEIETDDGSKQLQSDHDHANSI